MWCFRTSGCLQGPRDPALAFWVSKCNWLGVIGFERLRGHYSFLALMNFLEHIRLLIFSVNLGFGAFNPSNLDLTSVPWSRIMLLPFWNSLSKMCSAENAKMLKGVPYFLQKCCRPIYLQASLEPLGMPEDSPIMPADSPVMLEDDQCRQCH